MTSVLPDLGPDRPDPPATMINITINMISTNAIIIIISIIRTITISTISTRQWPRLVAGGEARGVRARPPLPPLPPGRVGKRAR